MVEAEAPYKLGRIRNPNTPRAAALYPVTRRPDYRESTRTYNYWWQGGAWLDQGPYGTCVGNAFAHRRADAPVPIEGITQEWARELYLVASGDTTYQNGTSALAACQVLAYKQDIGTLDLPVITAYHWVTSAKELRDTVLNLGTVCVGVNWYNSMFNPVRQYDNSYIKVDTSTRLAGGHEFVINGINLNPAMGPPFYRMKNSWGTSWGHKGTARFATRDLEDLIFNRGGDAVIITELPA